MNSGVAGIDRDQARLAPATSVTGLIAVLRRASAVVAGDTGPLHLAAALGRPVVGIFGPTDPTNTAPLGESVVLPARLACSPCYALRSPADCKLPDRSIACMWAISADAACEAIGRVQRASLQTPR